MPTAELPTVFEQAKALKSLDGKPLAVLTASVEQSGWLTAQKKLVRLSRNSVQRTIVGATHAALLGQRLRLVHEPRDPQVVQFARSGQR
jgi:hypothetical protein